MSVAIGCATYHKMPWEIWGFFQNVVDKIETDSIQYRLAENKVKGTEILLDSFAHSPTLIVLRDGKQISNCMCSSRAVAESDAELLYNNYIAGVKGEFDIIIGTPATSSKDEDKKADDEEEEVEEAVTLNDECANAMEDFIATILGKSYTEVAKEFNRKTLSEWGVRLVDIMISESDKFEKMFNEVYE